MDQMATFNISQDDNESDTSQEDLDDTNDKVDNIGIDGRDGDNGEHGEVDRVAENVVLPCSEASEGSDNAIVNVIATVDDGDGGTKKNYAEMFRQWSREEVKEVNASEPLRFMLLDTDFSIISAANVDQRVIDALPDHLKSQKEHAYNRLYGVTETGQSVLINAFGFLPYFYATPSNDRAFEQEAIQHLQEWLNAEIIKVVQNKLDMVIPFHDIVQHTSPILEIQVLNVSDVNIYEFHQPGRYSNNASQEAHFNPGKGVGVVEHSTPEKRKLKSENSEDLDSGVGEVPRILKIFCHMPKFVWIAAELLQKNSVLMPVTDDDDSGESEQSRRCYFQTFENSINHNIRFLTDRNICGCSWLKIPPGKYFCRQPNSKLSYCQIEVDAHYESTSSAAIQYTAIPPLRILSFDIECMVTPPNYVFPRGGQAQVLQIGTILTTHRYADDGSSEKGDENAIEKFIFMLGSCDPMEDTHTHVLSFDDEVEMFEAWRLFVIMTDPDILMGYNIKRFDMPYLLERANVIKARKLPFLGRIKKSECIARKIQNESKKAIKYDEKNTSISGRVIFDMMVLVMRHNVKRGRCQLADVAKRYLSNSHELKQDVSYRDIHKLQDGGPDGRKKLASYCVQDARLPYLIMLEHNPNTTKDFDFWKKGLVFDTLSYYIDKARVSGTPLRYLVTKSPEYNTYFKVIRKHKNPSVTFIPNTPARTPGTPGTPLHLQQANKRKNLSPGGPPGLMVNNADAKTDSQESGSSSGFYDYISDSKRPNLCKQLFIAEDDEKKEVEAESQESASASQ